jgi:predicted nucleic acid-binding protein
MIVVADTSPLNYLILLRQVDLLHDLFGEVLVPYGVLEEMQHPDAPDAVRNWAANPPSWMEPRRVEDVSDNINPALGRGEREAISLALTSPADLLLIDERAGRFEAESHSLNVAGTVAVLFQGAVKHGLDFPALLSQLRSFGFRLSRQVEEGMLERYYTQQK